MRTSKSKLGALLCAASMLLLTSCSGGESSAASSGGESQSTASSSAAVSESTSASDASDSADTAEPTAESAGESSFQSESDSNAVTRIGFLGEEAAVTLSDLSAPDGDGTLYLFSGYGYVEPSDGTVTVLTADEYEQKVNSGEEVETARTGEYTRIETGAEVGGLTLSSAEGWIVYADENPETVGELNYEELTFTGERTMKGYIYTYNGEEDAGYATPGDMYFLPADGEWEGLPVCGKSGIIWLNDDFIWVCNAPNLYLGNTDTDDIPDADNIERGKVYEVTVEVSALLLKTALCDNTSYSMQLNSATITGISEYKEVE